MDKQPHPARAPSGDGAESAPMMAARLAARAAPGHFDELRGAAGDSPGTLGAPWARFFDTLKHDGAADLTRRMRELERQVSDNGITYNVYADANGSQRPWSLDLFPLLVTPESWRQVEAGVLQRVKLLDRILADVYGPQELLARNFLPPALVQGHPGYLRGMHGIEPPGGSRLHIAAFDLARGPDGGWWVVSQRTQAPSGLGYLLENRQVTSRLFPDAFRELRVQRLAGTYGALADALRAMCPRDGDAAQPRIVLLTPGPYNETYFEHAYLARYLGMTLVEGSDLSVRGGRLFLKTLRGLEPVHGILKRLDDEFLDPLELRPDSRLGVPGLLQAMRAGNVLVANAPGSAFLESSAVLGFLPALSQHLLGETLQLPSLATWWCGERAAMEAALPQLPRSVVKPTYASPGAGAVPGKSLARQQLDEWAGRIVREPDDHTLQADLPLAQMPTWKPGARGGCIEPRPFMLRVFAVADGPRSWRVLPGGLTRIAGANDDIASMQRGGSSADTWVLTDGEVDGTTLLRHGPPTVGGAHRTRTVTSRAAENLFWLGRYTERTESTARLARLGLDILGGEGAGHPAPLAWLTEVARANGLVLPAVPPAAQARRVFERSLIAALADARGTTGVGYNLRALREAASSVRERLSQEQWNAVVHAEQAFFHGCAKVTQDRDFRPTEAMRVLDALLGATAAMTGAQADRMTRDDGWRLLAAGRHLERLGFLSSALGWAFETGAVFDEAGFEAIVSLFDSTAAFHAQHLQRHDIPALVDVLVLDRDNPRSLGWVAQALRGQIARLSGSAAGEVPGIARAVPDPAAWQLEALCPRDAQGRWAALEALLQECTDASYRLSDDLGARYFTHSDGRTSVGA